MGQRDAAFASPVVSRNTRPSCPAQYGNYGFAWPADALQPLSRSPHLAYHFNAIAHDVVRAQNERRRDDRGHGIRIADGYWLTLPRPDHTETSARNRVGRHLVHPGYEVLSVLARRWVMLLLRGPCGEAFEECLAHIAEG